MPLTVPNIIKSYARGGGSIAFTLDIEPSAVDTWTTKRFATAKLEIDGDAYDEATLGGLQKIGFEAKVIQGGNVATLPDVDVKLINKAKLHEEFLTDIIEGRRAVVQMTAIGPNICLNSSFEKRTADDFESWTETPGAGGGTVTAETGTFYDGAVACKLTGGTDGSYIRSDALTWKIGSKVIVSCYARTASGTATLKAAVHVTSGTLWYNSAAKTFGISRVKNTLGVATSTAWQRFSLEMDWADFYTAIGSGATLLVEQPFYVELWCEPSESVIVDAVQIELNNQLTPYNHNRYELAAADACTVFTGVVKNPSWAADEISISLEAWDSNKHRDIPKTILTAATDATWIVPKDSLGKPFPMTYGDFTSGGERPWNQRIQELQPMARGLLANTDNAGTGGIVVFFDRPALALYHPSTCRLFHYNEDEDRHYEQMEYDHASYAYDDIELLDDLAANAKFKASANPQYLLQGKMPLMAALCGRQMVSPYQITDYAKIRDGSLATYGYTNFAGIAHFGCILEPFNIDPGNLLVDANLAHPHYCIFVLGDFQVTQLADGDTSLAFDYLSRDGWQIFTLSAANLWTDDAGTFDWRNTPAKRTVAANKKLTEVVALPASEEPLPITMEATVAIDCTGASGPEVRVYEVGLLAYFALPLEEVTFASQLYGRTFGTTWGSRKTAANMVESGPEVIESILREELGAVDADINTTLFDAADSARAIAAAGQLHEVENSMDVVKGICKNFGLLYYIDILGKHSLVNLDWRAVTKHLFLHDWYKPFSNVKISYTPRSEIVNDIILHYDKNQFTGEYRKVAFCNKDACSGAIEAAYVTKCAASYAELGNKVQALELNCDWIKATATAEAMVKWTIDWLYKARLIITGDIFLDNMDLAMGDIADVDLEPLLPKSFTSTARFMAIATSISRTNSRLTVKLLEVKEP